MVFLTKTVQVSLLFGVRCKMTIKWCLAAFVLGLVAESKPLRLVTRLLSWVSAGKKKLDEKLDKKLAEDEE